MIDHRRIFRVGVCMILLVIFLTITSFASVIKYDHYTVVPDLEAIGADTSGASMGVWTDFNGRVSDISFNFSSTGATSGTRYGTESIYIIVDGKQMKIPTMELLKDVTPAGGEKVTSQISVTRDQLMKAMGVHEGTPAYESLSQALLNPKNIKVRADIVIRKGGVVVDRIDAFGNLEMQFAAMKSKYGFDQSHIDDWWTRFHNLDEEYPEDEDEDDPDPDPTPDPSGGGGGPSGSPGTPFSPGPGSDNPGSGVRPTIILW